MTSPDAIVVRFDDTRLRFEPREGGWRMFDERWNGHSWRTAGTQLVETLRVSQPQQRCYAGP